MELTHSENLETSAQNTVTLADVDHIKKRGTGKVPVSNYSSFSRKALVTFINASSIPNGRNLLSLEEECSHERLAENGI